MSRHVNNSKGWDEDFRSAEEIIAAAAVSMQTAAVFDTTILPSQYFERLGEASPERRLLAAILADAVNLANGGGIGTGNSQRARKLRAEACYWLFDAFADDSYISFQAVCEVFGWDITRMRAGLRAMLARHEGRLGIIRYHVDRPQAMGEA